MKKLTGALIGCGAIAREHLVAVSALDNAEIAAVCDISAARAEAAAERFHIAKWYTNYQQLIADIRPDLVHITTSPASHFAIANTCLSAGLNVLCEKPIAVDYAQFEQLRKIATSRQCLLIENQNLRFHSSILRVQDLLNRGLLGEILDLQICLSLNILAPDSLYTDKNQVHPALSLRGGIIGDFLPHVAYLAHMFVGPIGDLQTIWIKHTSETVLPWDEFRGLLRGERATAYVSFSGNAQPDGFWIRVIGTRAHVEVNLFEPPRLTMRRARPGEPALMRLVDGLAELRDVLKGSIAGFWRKLAGRSSYDGLAQLIARTYSAMEKKGPPPVGLADIDAAARLVERFTATCSTP